MAEPFDLDAVGAARREAAGDAPMFIFGGQKFVLPVELPAEFAYLLRDYKAAMRFILGDDFDDFWAHGPTKADLDSLVRWVMGRYGMQLGESTASDGSSPTSGTGSRPTSPATTSSISDTSASASHTSSSEPGDSPP